MTQPPYATSSPDAHHAEPIVAIATPPGQGGIGVIRISGTQLDALAHALFGRTLTPRQAHYLPFNDADGQAIDAGIVLYFKGPHSYTGEDVLELQGHGGPAVLRRVLQRCMEVGQDLRIRHAQPGEFTQRAFLNDRLDLAQAEAVADLIEASSEAAAKSAMASLSGDFSDRITDLNDRIIHLRMLVEATLDFPEEEIDFLEKYQAAETLAGIRQTLSDIQQQSKRGMVLREGLHVVLAGQPNVGKSSLLNALAGDDIAIVTDIAGTTRDRVTQLIHLNGVPLHIIDTAGLRETTDTVESLGIARSWAEIEKADVIIHLQDARQHATGLDAEITRRLPANTPVLNVFNKSDLVDGPLPDQALKTESEDTSDTENERTSTQTRQPTRLFISARTGYGLDALRHALLDIAGWSTSAQSPWLARQRHVDALERAGQHLSMAADHAAQSDQVLDLFAEELRLAHDSLSEITGAFTSDDLLGEIFSSFCIGK